MRNQLIAAALVLTAPGLAQRGGITSVTTSQGNQPSVYVFTVSGQNPCNGVTIDFVQADVVVRVARIPIKSAGNRSSWNSCRDNVSATRCLLGVEDYPIVHWRVRRDDDVVGGDDVAVTSSDFGRLAVLDALGVSCGIELATVANNCTCETIQIFQRMELGLAGKAQRRARLE